MSMFDIVHVPCPSCGTTAEFQSKSGSCLLKDYELATATPEVLRYVNRHSPYTCMKCETVFQVELGSEDRTVKWLVGKSIVVKPGPPKND